MEIVLLVNNRKGVGTYLRAYGFGRALAQRGHGVTLLASSSARSVFWTEEQLPCGIRLVLFPRLFQGPAGAGYDPYELVLRIAFLSVKKWGRRRVVHSYESRPSTIMPALFLKFFFKFKLFVDRCDDFKAMAAARADPPLKKRIIEVVEGFFQDFFVRYSDGITCINKSLAPARSLKNGRAVPVNILDNGLDAIQYLGSSSRNAAPPFKILHVGTILPEDACGLIEAFSYLTERSDNFRLILVGEIWDRFKNMLAGSRHVIQHGYVSNEELGLLAASAHVGLLPLFNVPANSGRSPIKFLKYVQYGLPVISTTNFDNASILEAFGCGQVTCPNPKSFAAALESISYNSDWYDDLCLGMLSLRRRYPSWGDYGQILERFFLNSFVDDSNKAAL